MSAENPTPGRCATPPANKRAGRYAWLWFFLIVFVLAVAAIATLWVYNVQQQLTRAKLAQARALWQQNGPKDYNLTYSTTGSLNAKITVRVRGGTVVYAEPDSTHTLAQKQVYYGMPAFFKFLEDYLNEAAKPDSPRTYLIAKFDPHDGHLEHFIRSVMGTSERLEITVEEFRPIRSGSSARE